MKLFKYKLILLYIIISINLIDLNSTEKMKLDINRAVIMAITRNTDLKISKETLKISNKAFFYDLRKFLPTLNMGISNSTSVALDSPDSRSTSLNLGMNILLFDSGKLIFDSIVKKAEMDIKKKELLLQINKIIMDTKNQYYSLLLLFEKEAQQSELLKIGLIQEEHAELELDLGAISEIDYYEIKLKVKQIQVDFENAKREKNIALREFKYNLGLEESYIDLEIEKDIKYEFLNLTEEDTRFLQSIALANRLDVSQSIHSLTKSKVQFWYTVLSFAPEISTDINFALTDEEFPPRNKSWSITLNVKLPLAYFPINYSPSIGSSGANNEKRGKSESSKVDAIQNITYENDIAQSRIDVVSNGIKHKELIRQIKNEVNDAVEDYIDSLRIYKLKLEQNKLAQQKLNIMRLKLELGEVKRVDLLEEEMEYKESIIEEKDLLYQLSMKELQMQEILGLEKREISLSTMIKNMKDNRTRINEIGF